MPGRWYSSCPGVSAGGHRLDLIKSGWGPWKRRHLICVEPGCTLFLSEPRIRQGSIRLGVKLSARVTPLSPYIELVKRPLITLTATVILLVLVLYVVLPLMAAVEGA